MKLTNNHKREREYFNKIERAAKAEKCFICGKKISSPCNSHVVPQFILRNIAENGTLNYGTSMATILVSGFKNETGINNAHTFRLLCHNCDNSFFKDYENPNNLMNFDKLNSGIKNKILCEMAIKARLSHINMKWKEIIHKNNMMNGHYKEELIKKGLLSAEEMDIRNHDRNIGLLMKSMFVEQDTFEVLFNCLLDYRVKIATQTIILYYYDLKGNKIFDNQSMFIQYSFFYLVILPLKEKTRILFFIEKEYTKNVDGLIKQFKELSDEDKIHFLFMSLISHDEQFYMSPSLSNYINKNDKRIKKMYTKTALNMSNLKKIKNFRKYNNYLLHNYEKDF